MTAAKVFEVCPPALMWAKTARQVVMRTPASCNIKLLTITDQGAHAENERENYRVNAGVSFGAA